MNAPLITIGITCFREGDWLLECWNSVLAQTDDRWEAVLVMDGGANERTRQVFESLEHPRLRKTALPENLGPYPTRNKAFELTRTPFHFYLDGDDQLPADALARVLGTFELNPDAGLVYGDYQCFGAGDEIWRYPAQIRPAEFAERQPIPGGCAYRTSVWKKLGGFAEELAGGNADYDFMLGVAEAGIAAVHCGGIFYRYRLRASGNTSGSYNLSYHRTHEIMVSRHPAYFSELRYRRRFLALGYQRAAWANWRAGRLKQAGRLAWRTVRQGLLRDWRLLLLCPAALFSFPGHKPANPPERHA